MIFFLLAGIIQGLTEFLPVSSSGHLVLFKHFSSVPSEVYSIDIFLHTATLLAVLVYFRSDIYQLFTKDYQMLKLVILANIPFFAGAILFRNLFESLYGIPTFVFTLLIFNGAWMIAAHYMYQKKGCVFKEINNRSALWMGASQVLAIFPGISRSGMTISTALFNGTNREAAFRFSFIMSIPAISAAMLFKAHEIVKLTTQFHIYELLTGFGSAFIVGLLALSILFKAITSEKFHLFGYYCICVGLLGIIL